MNRIAFHTAGALLATSLLLHAQSAPAQPAPAVAPSVRFVVIGCLARQGTAAAPRFVITDTRGDRPTVYRLQGDAALLAAHVGHTVEVAGPLSAPAAGSAQYTLRVNSLTWLTSSCSQGSK